VNEYIFFMRTDDLDSPSQPDTAWAAYFATLRAAGAFDGGSAIGDGVCMSKGARPVAITRHIAGYIRIRAANLAAAQALVVGNPVYEAGGAVEIRGLPTTG
jgi:hypothetical protein